MVQEKCILKKTVLYISSAAVNVKKTELSLEEFLGMLSGLKMSEMSFVMLKPDAVLRRYSGKILTRFEEKGLKIVATKLLIINKELAEKHYAEHSEKPFFKDLVDYITSGPVLAFVFEGEGCIPIIRKIVGATNPKEAELGSIRGDYAIDTGRNIIHASDSIESAEREINLFFNNAEIHKYKLPDEELIYEEP